MLRVGALVLLLLGCASVLSTNVPAAHHTMPSMNPPNPASVEVLKKPIDSPLEDIQWASDDTVFVLTEKGQIWRSADSGKTWKNANIKLSETHVAEETSGVKSIYISPVDSQFIFLLGSSKTNWWSDDQGKTFHACEKDLHDVRMHPTQRKWMLGATMSAGCANRESDVPCYKQLHVSKNLCVSWEEVDRYVVQFDWAPPIGPPDNEGNRASDSLIFVTTHSKKEGAQRFGFWDKDINFVQSYNFFQTPPTVLVPHGNRFLFGDHSYLFVAAVNPVHETEVNLMISRDNVTHQLFQKAILPVDLTQHSYTILDTSEGSVFLHVNHQPFSENAATGHVYISDWSGLLYSLSLPYNHRSSDGKCDFEKVEGLEGIYLANFIDEAAGMDEEEAEETRPNADSDHTGRPKHMRPRTKTVITFDKGGLWSYLKPPDRDSIGEDIHCGDGCHLHLHGITDTFGPFYSTASATGIIMATGTIGNHLQDGGDVNTYLSRDAGLTWYEVRKGSHIYEFGDHGGLIVMADDNKLTNVVYYSWDSGHTWTELEISKEHLQVENIIIEPTATGQIFIVYGWQESSGVLIYLNFADLHERECVGHDRPGSDSSTNYELWSPSDGRIGQKCLMGHTISYTRRKPFDQCFNPDAYERSVLVSHCPCTKEDFECDYGYERKETIDEQGNRVLDSPCVPMTVPPSHKDPTATEDCIKTQRISRGYRRVPGDTCTGGSDQYDAEELPCPGILAKGNIGKILLILFVIAALSVCLISLNNKYNLLGPCMNRFRGLYIPYMPVDKQRPVDGISDPEEHYLNDEEFSKSAELLSDGVAKKDKKPGSSSAADAHGHGEDDKAGESLKPLPPAKPGDTPVPVLAPPKAGADGHAHAGEHDDEFNPRKRS